MIESYKGRDCKAVMPVFVYRNLHKAAWSIKALAGPDRGLVVGHADSLLLFGTHTKVSEPGRRRVVATGRKNVHAGVVGLIATVTESDLVSTYGAPRKLSYSPFVGPFFTVNDEPISAASYVSFSDNGKAYTFGSIA